MAKQVIALAVLILMVACTQDDGTPDQVATIENLTQRYLLIELSMGQLDAGHVDAYFGPEEIRTAAINAGLSLDDIRSGSIELEVALRALDMADDDALAARVEGLLARLLALETRIAMMQGEVIPFDDEVRRLFATSLSPSDAGYFDSVVQEIESLIPGDGLLSERVDAFLDTFNIPADRLSAVFDAAIAECRRRTVAFIDLPAEENFTVEYVTDQPWSGYNWYQGDAISLIQVNTDLPSRINSAVTLGCHEGYPGHHVYNTLLEQNLVKDQGWLEFSLYPLFSPQSLIAEGSGNYGIELAFPGDERIEFEKNVLFPLAGLDPNRADVFYRLLELQAELDFSRNDAARRFLNGDADTEQTIQQIMKYSLTTRKRAEQGLSFIKTYRSYVINYNHGKALVAGFIERGTQEPAERWAKFETLLSTAMLPKDLEYQ